MSDYNRSSTLTLRGSMSTVPRPRRVETPRDMPLARSQASSASKGAEQGTVQSDTLLQGRSHVLITHNGETYQLRATRLGKLILTK